MSKNRDQINGYISGPQRRIEENPLVDLFMKVSMEMHSHVKPGEKKNINKQKIKKELELYEMFLKDQDEYENRFEDTTYLKLMSSLFPNVNRPNMLPTHFVDSNKIPGVTIEYIIKPDLLKNISNRYALPLHCVQLQGTGIKRAANGKEQCSSQREYDQNYRMEDDQNHNESYVPPFVRGQK